VVRQDSGAAGPPAALLWFRSSGRLRHAVLYGADFFYSKKILCCVALHPTKATTKQGI